MKIDKKIQAVTVRQISQLHSFKKYAHLVAGEKGLDRLVSQTTVWEAPDLAARLEGNEFVFSVGYLTKINPKLALKGFDALTDVVSALCFKLNLYLDEVPEEYIRIANKKNVPLFVIGRECLFKWLIQSIMAEINLYHASVLMEVDQYFHELYELCMKDGGDVALLTHLSERLKARCLLLSPDLQTFTWPRTVLSNQEKAQINNEIYEFFQKYCIRDEEFHSLPWHIYPLTAKNICLGYLIVDRSLMLTEKERLMIQQLQMRLTMKWSERYADSQRILMELWNNLMTSAKDKRENICRKLSGYGINPDKPFCVMVYGARKKHAAEFHKDAQFSIGAFGRLIPHKVHLWLSPVECAILCGSIQEKTFILSLEQFRRQLSAEKSGILSIGPVVSDIDEIRDSYRIARNTQIASYFGLHEQEPLLYYEDYLPELALMQGIGSIESNLFVEKTLMPLIHYDAEHGGRNCIETLRVLTQTENLENAAELLHVHCNTLRYRIQKIKDLSGRDLFSYRDRAIFRHALFCHEMNKNS